MSDSRPGRGLLLPVAVLAAATAATAACGADDRTMTAPTPEQTTTTAPPVEGVGGTTPAAAFELTTTAFTPGTVIPDRYTCRGMDTWPGLSWSNVPEGTRSLAVVVRDLTGGGAVHWLVAGIDPALDGLVEGELPDGAVEAANHLGEPGWAGPCPSPGSGEHTYEFRLYALAEAADVTPGAESGSALAAVESTPGYGSAVLLGTAGPLGDEPAEAPTDGGDPGTAG